jgi:hypothetical protein
MKQFWTRIQTEFREQVWDHEQVLKLRQKFGELDAQTQSYVLIGSFAGFVAILLLTFFGLWIRTISIKSDLSTMDQEIRRAQVVAAKIEEAKAAERNKSSDPLLATFDTSGAADAFAERVGQKALIAKSSVEVTNAKAATADLKLNKISLRQLARAIYLIEKSNSGASVEKLSVDARDDTEGYLWAQLTIRKEAAKGGL